MSRAGLARSVALAAIVAACGGGRATPHDPVAPAPAVALDAGVDAGPDVEMLADLADGLAETLATMAELTATAPDCATMAINLERLFDQASPLFDLARAQASDPAAARLLTAAMDARAAEVGPRVERISRGLARCQRDPAVAAAMARMPTF